MKKIYKKPALGFVAMRTAMSLLQISADMGTDNATTSGGNGSKYTGALGHEDDEDWE